MGGAGVRNRPQLGPFAAAQKLGKVEKVPGAYENVDLGKLLTKLGPVALRTFRALEADLIASALKEAPGTGPARVGAQGRR